MVLWPVPEKPWGLRSRSAAFRSVEIALVLGDESRLYADSGAYVNSGQLIHGCSGFQVYLTPFPGDDPFPNLRCGFVFLVLGICVIQFFEADVAPGPVRAFKTAT